jgi:hypothetical protein
VRVEHEGIAVVEAVQGFLLSTARGEDRDADETDGSDSGDTADCWAAEIPGTERPEWSGYRTAPDSPTPPVKTPLTRTDAAA